MKIKKVQDLTGGSSIMNVIIEFPPHTVYVLLLEVSDELFVLVNFTGPRRLDVEGSSGCAR